MEAKKLHSLQLEDSLGSKILNKENSETYEKNRLSDILNDYNNEQELNK